MTKISKICNLSTKHFKNSIRCTEHIENLLRVLSTLKFQTQFTENFENRGNDEISLSFREILEKFREFDD